MQFYGEDFQNDGRRREAKGLPLTRKVYEPKSLNALHLRILQLKSGGLKNRVIAELCMCTKETVCNVVNSDLGRRKLAALIHARDAKTIDIRMEIAEMAGIAVKTMRAALDEELQLTDKDRVGVAKDVLDMAGFGPRNTNLHAHVHFTKEELDEIKARARQSAAECGVIIDAEVVELPDAVDQE